MYESSASPKPHGPAPESGSSGQKPENPSREGRPGLAVEPEVGLGGEGEVCYMTGKEFHKNKIPFTHTQACVNTRTVTLTLSIKGSLFFLKG